MALLRGVSPLNAKMPALRRCFEAAGFTDVKTVIASGNVVFSSRSSSEQALELKAEAAMTEYLGRSFPTIVRSIASLETLLKSDPYASVRLPSNAKRVVTFVREPVGLEFPLPAEVDGARIVAVTRREVFSAYVPTPKGPVFMALIEKTFGNRVTTRTWETIRKCVAAAR